MTGAKIGFFSEPTKAVEYLKNKKPQVSFDYDELSHSTHKKVFTIAKLMDESLLKDMQDTLVNAIKNGDKFSTWSKIAEEKLKAKGWWGSKEVINTKTGEVKKTHFNSARLKKIFEENSRKAKAKAIYENQMKSTKPYLKYCTKQDALVRDKHRAFDGIVLPKDDPFWDTHYPDVSMHDYGCRCYVLALGENEVKGLKTPPSSAKESNFNGLNDEELLDELYKQKNTEVIQNFIKLDMLSAAAKKAKEVKSFNYEKELYTWQKSLDDMVDEVIIKENQKYPINFIQVGKMDKTTKEFLEKLNKKDLEDLYFTLSKNNLLHASPKRKASYNQALSVDEIKQIVKVLDEAKEVYWDKKEESLVYFFDDIKNSKKVNKIIIRVDYKLKKFGKTNAVITLGKVEEDNKKQQELIKIR
ncbi:phage Mu protein F-like protein [Campylobacter lari]|uniref:phage head morphogenesis protein n=1 Tax=Campylobacter lari TaxID=201 RepID=UPI002153A5E2|nr:phage minor head protein [Campylobacter lari]MCR6538453.1 phage minor head protein [Campylobacter lari]